MFDDTSYTLRFPRKAALLSVLVAVAVVGYNTESAERRRHKQQQNSNGGRRGGGGGGGGGNRGSGRHGHCFASENQTSREIVLTF